MSAEMSDDWMVGLMGFELVGGTVCQLVDRLDRKRVVLKVALMDLE